MRTHTHTHSHIHMPTCVRSDSQVEYVTAEDIPADVYAREREIEMGREDLKSKPGKAPLLTPSTQTCSLLFEQYLFIDPAGPAKKKIRLSRGFISVFEKCIAGSNSRYQVVMCLSLCTCGLSVSKACEPFVLWC